MTITNDIEKRLWAAADQLWANSSLKPSEFSTPVLGLIFLRYADHKFSLTEADFSKASMAGRHKVSKIDYQARGILYLSENARFSNIKKNVPEGGNLGKTINDAMRTIETDNEDLRGVLPTNYNRLDNSTLIELLRILGSIPMDIEGDAFGKIYEYFLGNFAMKEGQKGGVFYTPTSIVRLIVSVIEPYHGLIYDPACGSGGMFVQSARFVEKHKRNPTSEISIYGQEKVAETIRLCKMNLAVHGLSGDIREGNSYYEDLHDSFTKFDFVMANPPFNVSGVDTEKIKDDHRFSFGIPHVNANYLWIQVFHSALNDKGRGGFVMANSAADTRGIELEIRRRLIESGVVDVLISVSPHFFYTVTLPCTLWFFDKAKARSDRKDKTLFIDAKRTYRQVDRAHREFTSQQIEFLANIVRLYRGEKIENEMGSESLIARFFGETHDSYKDVPGLCKAATINEIEARTWSLNPGRYVGVPQESTRGDLFERLKALNEKLEALNTEAGEMESRVSERTAKILERNG